MSLTLTWRALPPPLTLTWRGPDQSVTSAVAQNGMTAVAAIVGPPGPSGSAGVTATRTAGEALGGHRAVAIRTDGKAWYVSPTDALVSVFGLTTGAASLGADVAIQSAGEMIEPSWNWTQGPVYLGASGTLTQTVPVAGAIVEIGIAGGPTSITINPRVVARL